MSMAVLVVRGFDLLAVGSAGVATAMAVVYRGVVEGQSDSSDGAFWVQAVLFTGALLALAGAPADGRLRVPVLLVASGLMGVVGILGLLTIGLPILGAAGLAFLAALRSLTAPRSASAT